MRNVVYVQCTNYMLLNLGKFLNAPHFQSTSSASSIFCTLYPWSSLLHLEYGISSRRFVAELLHVFIWNMTGVRSVLCGNQDPLARPSMLCNN